MHQLGQLYDPFSSINISLTMAYMIRSSYGMVSIPKRHVYIFCDTNTFASTHAVYSYMLQTVRCLLFIHHRRNSFFWVFAILDELCDGALVVAALAHGSSEDVDAIDAGHPAWRTFQVGVNQRQRRRLGQEIFVRLQQVATSSCCCSASWNNAVLKKCN